MTPENRARHTTRLTQLQAQLKQGADNIALTEARLIFLRKQQDILAGRATELATLLAEEPAPEPAPSA